MTAELVGLAVIPLHTSNPSSVVSCLACICTECRLVDECHLVEAT